MTSKSLKKHPAPVESDWDLSTKAVRGGTLRSQFGEHSEAIFLTSSFVFDSAQEAADKFADRFEEGESGYVYSRYDNPNTAMLESRLAALEGAESAITFASGLAAHFAVIMTFLKTGDEIISARDIFGSTHKLYDHWLRRFGINTHFVAIDDIQAWEQAITPKTKMLYVESPSNPINRIADFQSLSAIAKRHGLMLVVDNTFSTPFIQQPLLWGADLVTYSATKFFDGQGRTLAGAVVGDRARIDELRLFLRSVGPCLSPFNAWLIFKGLETLSLRIERQCATALSLATKLAAHPQVESVLYPWLKNHPQNALAMAQMKAGGTIITFHVKSPEGHGQAYAWKMIDALTLFSRTANLGDTRSTITHPATTTHGRLNPEERKKAGIYDHAIRLAIGLESERDLWVDLVKGLSTLTLSS